MNPPLDIATALASYGIGLTLGTNLFVGGLREGVPINAVFVAGGPGGRPERAMGEKLEIRRPLVHTRIRNNKYETGDSMARSVQDKLRAAIITGYDDVVATQTEPTYLGMDDIQRHHFIVSFSVLYQVVAA